MNCRKVRSYLSASFDGSLSSDVAKRVEDHLRDCTDCEREQFLLKEMLAAARSMPKAHVADDFNLKLLNRIYAEQNHPTESYLPSEAPAFWQRPLGWLSAAASVAACVLVAVVFFGSGADVKQQTEQPVQLIADNNSPSGRDYAVQRAHEKAPMTAYEYVIGIAGERSSYRATHYSNPRTLRVANEARVESLYTDWLLRLGEQNPPGEYLRNAAQRIKFGSRAAEPELGAMNAGVVRTSYTR